MQFPMPRWWRAYRERWGLVAGAPGSAAIDTPPVSENPAGLEGPDDILARFLEQHTAEVIDLASRRMRRAAALEQTEEPPVQAAAATAGSLRLDESLSR